MDDTFVNHLCPLGPEFLLSVLRLSALTTRGSFSGNPLDLVPFLKSVEKGATTLVLFGAYARLLTVAFGCFTYCCLRVFTLCTVLHHIASRLI